MHNNCAETHLGGGVMSPFVSPLSAIARVHDPTVISSVALRKGPRRFCPHCSDCCRALMLMCRNSPLWQRCEYYNNVLSSFWPPWLARTWSIEQHGHHMTCALIGMSRKLAAFNYTSRLVLWTTLEYKLVDVNGVCQRIQKVRVEPATRSAVATWSSNKLIHPGFIFVKVSDFQYWQMQHHQPWPPASQHFPHIFKE